LTQMAKNCLASVHSAQRAYHWWYQTPDRQLCRTNPSSQLRHKHSLASKIIVGAPMWVAAPAHSGASRQAPATTAKTVVRVPKSTTPLRLLPAWLVITQEPPLCRLPHRPKCSERRYGTVNLPPLDDTIERYAHLDVMIALRTCGAKIIVSAQKIRGRHSTCRPLIHLLVICRLRSGAQSMPNDAHLGCDPVGQSNT
jgi:hypothetical protein